LERLTSKIRVGTDGRDGGETGRGKEMQLPREIKDMISLLSSLLF
jgi:hypothetical protein